MSSCATNRDCSSGNVCVNRTCQPPPSQGLPFYVWVVIGIGAGILFGAIVLVVFRRRKRNSQKRNRQKIKTGRKSERLNPPLYNRGEGDGPAPLPQGYKKPIDLFQVAQLNRNEEAKRLSRLSAAYYALSQVGSDEVSVHSNQSQYGEYPQPIQMRPVNSNRNSFIPFSHESRPRPVGTSGENYRYSYAYPTMVYNTQTSEMGMRGVSGTSGSRLSMMHMGVTPVPLPNFENSNYNSRGNGSAGRGVELRHSKSAYSHPYQGVYDGSQAVADARGMNISQDRVSVKRTQSDSETASSFIPQNQFILPEHQISNFRDFNDPESGKSLSEENLQNNSGFFHQGQLKDEPSLNQQMTMVDRRKTLTLDMRYFEAFGNTNTTPTTPSKTTPLINLGNSGRNNINEDNTAMQDMAKMERNESKSFEMGNQMINESLGPLSPSMVTPVFNPNNLKVRQQDITFLIQRRVSLPAQSPPLDLKNKPDSHYPISSPENASFESTVVNPMSPILNEQLPKILETLSNESFGNNESHDQSLEKERNIDQFSNRQKINSGQSTDSVEPSVQTNKEEATVYKTEFPSTVQQNAQEYYHSKDSPEAILDNQSNISASDDPANAPGLLNSMQAIKTAGMTAKNSVSSSQESLQTMVDESEDESSKVFLETCHNSEKEESSSPPTLCNVEKEEILSQPKISLAVQIKSDKDVSGPLKQSPEVRDHLEELNTANGFPETFRDPDDESLSPQDVLEIVDYLEKEEVSSKSKDSIGREDVSVSSEDSLKYSPERESVSVDSKDSPERFDNINDEESLSPNEVIEIVDYLEKEEVISQSKNSPEIVEEEPVEENHSEIVQDNDEEENLENIFPETKDPQFLGMNNSLKTHMISPMFSDQMMSNMFDNLPKEESTSNESIVNGKTFPDIHDHQSLPTSLESEKLTVNTQNPPQLPLRNGRLSGGRPLPSHMKFS